MSLHAVTENSEAAALLELLRQIDFNRLHLCQKTYEELLSVNAGSDFFKRYLGTYIVIDEEIPANRLYLLKYDRLIASLTLERKNV